MNWLNIETTTLDAEEFVGSDPVVRATWLCLLRFCCGQENGGVIVGCKSWPDRKWQQLARVTKSEVETESALWSWEGENLLVWRYPADKQSEVQQRRERARTNGGMGGRPISKPTLKPTSAPTLATTLEPTLATTLDSFAKAEGEGEGEGEGERKENEKEKDKDKEKDKEKLVAEVSAISDADWLAGLQKNPAYLTLNVHHEFAKMQTWCVTNKKIPTRRRFVNWLNRADKPIAVVEQRTWTPQEGGW